MKSENCPFCGIAAGEINATIVAQNEHGVVFRDADPEAPVHLLAIPREHVQSLAEADDPALLGELMSLAALAAREAGLDSNGYRVVTNIGQDGGQSVPHLHLHVLGGRPMDWPPG